MTSQTDNHAADANAKPETAPKRKPWVPPRFKCISADLVEWGHAYFDYDDVNVPGSGIGSPASTDPHPTWDQTNPHNS